MAKNIFMSAGSKGGVGKSLLAMAMVDYFKGIGEELLLIESDTSNPDVWKTYKDLMPVKLVNLDEADGWIELVNVCEQFPQSTIVVNTPSRNNTGVSAYGSTLNNALDELKRKLVTLWIINRQRDSLELLKEFMTAIPAAHVHVVRNAYYGTESKFELYNQSKLKTHIEGKGGLSLMFPDLADRVCDDLYSKRMSIEAACKEMPLGNRAELIRWKQEFKKMMEAIQS